MSFADDIKAFRQKALENTNTNICKIVEDLFVDEVLLSPTSPEAAYATGLLINSYYPAIASFDTTIGTSPDYYGGSSLSRIKTLLTQNPFLGKDNFVTLTNSVDHVYQANNLGWPQGLGANGWHWTGKVLAYHFRETAIANAIGKYK